MNKVIHRAETRGKSDLGWLHSNHTFSFSSYYDPERMGFGKLRVLNDDVVEPGGGFATHAHDNMEIVSIPLHGSLKHKDSMGNTHVIEHGEVQIMSAGTGLTHSEYNGSDNDIVNFLQIWIQPDKLDIQPRYGQMAFDPDTYHNTFRTVVSPKQSEDSIWINQDAYFSLGNLDAGQSVAYDVHTIGNGIYVFVLEGQVSLDGETLSKRDAIGLSGKETLRFEAGSDCRLLVIEVPMH